MCVRVRVFGGVKSGEVGKQDFRSYFRLETTTTTTAATTDPRSLALASSLAPPVSLMLRGRFPGV